MALSDCPKCWDTPCTCGWGYKRMSKEFRIYQAAIILGVNADELKDILGDFIPEDHPMKHNLEST